MKADAAPESRGAEITVALGREDAVIVSVGQILRVPVPAADRRWRIEYAADVLDPLTPAAEMFRPSGGWRFRAAAVGETDLVATAMEESGGAAPPAPVRFTVTIKVQQQ